MKNKHWLIGWSIIVLCGLSLVAGMVYRVDPFIHYHKPDTDKYFYTLNNQRSQNNGIVRFFDYDAIITGTSMTENFKTSEMDALWGCNSIKVSFSGASFKEINDNLAVAAKCNPNLRYIVRSLDISKFFEEKDFIRDDLGEYPEYLFDSNPFNDVNYLLNRDVIWNRAVKMQLATKDKDFKAGITSFDNYSRWQSRYVFGSKTVIPKGITAPSHDKQIHISDSEKQIIKENIEQNVTRLADAYPDITFYYFFTPYSAAWWRNRVSAWDIYKQIEAEEYIIELILEHKNIQLYSFSNRLDLTADLNNYKDTTHYGAWINSLMLKWMHDGEYLLTQENYRNYIAEELTNYLEFDYESLNNQTDYESDFYAAAILNKELSGKEPVNVLENVAIAGNILENQPIKCGLDTATEYNSPKIEITLQDATIVTDQYHDGLGIRCVGRLNKKSGSTETAYDVITSGNYIGAKITVTNADDYSYLVFYGKKIKDHGQPAVYVLNEACERVGSISKNYKKLDDNWHQYVIDLSDVTGNITIFFNGGYVDTTGSTESEYIFSGITLY